MGSEWKSLHLGKSCIKIGSGATPRGGKESYLEKGPMALIRSQNIYNDGFTPLGLAYISYEQAAKLDNVIVQKGDVLLNITGDSVARVCMAPANVLPARVNQHVAIIRPNTNLFNSQFLHYFLTSPTQQAHMLAIASVGATRNALTKGMIESFQVPCPNISEQERIAETLGILDDKIALNRQTNATLEAIAQALFKSWFVDFDPVRAKMEGREPEGMDEATAALFPSDFVESELGLIPKGWKVGCFQACCNRVESGGTPSRTNAGYWNGTISWLTSGEVRGIIVLQTKEKITKLGLNSSSAKLWPVMTTVVAMYGATAGQVCLLAEEMSANQACCALIPKAEFHSFVFFAARRAITELADKASGSAQQNLNKSLVANHKIIIPNQQVALFFEHTVSALMNKWISNQRQIESLANIRDTLLPKLISGQLRIPESENKIKGFLP